MSYIFKETTLKFIQPFQISVYNCHNPEWTKLFSRFRIGLSHLREHKFKHSFQDILNPRRNTLDFIPLHFFNCPSYLQENDPLECIPAYWLTRTF